MAATWTPKFEGTDRGGLPLVYGKLETYEAGTSTPLATYTSQDGLTQNANPVQLDSSGRANVWLQAGVPYKLVLRSLAGVVIWTVDNFAVSDPGLGASLSGGSGLSKIGFQQVGEGAVVVTAQDKMRRFNIDSADFGADTYDPSDQTAGVQSAVTEANNGNSHGPVDVLTGEYTVAGALTINGARGLIGRIAGKSVLNFTGTGDYGINVNGTGFGASATDTVEIGDLAVWGKRTNGLIRMNGTAVFNIHDVVAQNGLSSVLRFTNAQDGNADRLAFFSNGDASVDPEAGAVIAFGPACNNIKLDAAHVENPRQTAHYINAASNINFIGGKIDGGADPANVTTNPFITCSAGEAKYTNHLLTGFKSYPIQIRAWGQLSFLGSCVVQNGAAPAVFFSDSASYRPFDGVFRPGVIFKPYIKYRGRIHFASENTATNAIGAVIALYAPNPLMKPNTGNDGRVTLASVFQVSGKLYQCSMTEWNGSSFVAPAANNVYAGGYLVDKANGAVYGQVTSQSGSLVQFSLMGSTVPADGQFFIQYDNVHGVRVDIEATSPAYGVSRLNTRLAQVKYTVNVTGTAYDTNTGRTTVQLAETVPNDAAVGCFIRDQINDQYYYVIANAAGQLFCLHNRTAVLPNGPYEVVIGNPKAGRCIIYWEGEASDGDVTWAGEYTTASLTANSETDVIIPIAGMATITSFVASALPATSWSNFITRGAGIANPTNGVVHIANGPTAQTARISYVVTGKPLPGA
jgi:hypothetical protein